MQHLLAMPETGMYSVSACLAGADVHCHCLRSASPGGQSPAGTACKPHDVLKLAWPSCLHLLQAALVGDEPCEPYTDRSQGQGDTQQTRALCNKVCLSTLGPCDSRQDQLMVMQDRQSQEGSSVCK